MILSDKHQVFGAAADLYWCAADTKFDEDLPNGEIVV